MLNFFKKIINLFFTIAILWVGNTYFHDYIQIDSMQILVIAALIMYSVDILFGWFMLFSALLTPIGIGCISFIIGLLLIPFLDFLKLYYLTKYLNGFVINGIWTYIILVVALSIFRIRDKKDDKKEVK